uniref:Uncharacterized protein n=1 Tax=Anguilla anguilla TaxID=7936 RepID=A0A0E9WVM1_ANGAN
MEEFGVGVNTIFRKYNITNLTSKIMAASKDDAEYELVRCALKKVSIPATSPPRLHCPQGQTCSIKPQILNDLNLSTKLTALCHYNPPINTARKEHWSVE